MPRASEEGGKKSFNRHGGCALLSDNGSSDVLLCGQLLCRYRFSGLSEAGLPVVPDTFPITILNIIGGMKPLQR